MLNVHPSLLRMILTHPEKQPELITYELGITMNPLLCDASPSILKPKVKSSVSHTAATTLPLRSHHRSPNRFHAPLSTYPLSRPETKVHLQGANKEPHFPSSLQYQLHLPLSLLEKIAVVGHLLYLLMELVRDAPLARGGSSSM